MLGVNDGLVTNVCLILAVAGASSDVGAVRIAGLASLIAGAFSMAAEQQEDRDGDADADIEQRFGRGCHGPGRSLGERRRHGDREVVGQDQDDDDLEAVQQGESEVPAPEAGQARLVHPGGFHGCPSRVSVSSVRSEPRPGSTTSAHHG